MKNVIDVTSKGAMSRRGFIGFASVAALSAGRAFGLLFAGERRALKLL